MSDRLDADALTWAALLGRWMELAKAGLALDDDATGTAWRESIVPMVTLQAVTKALGELDRVAAAERAYGRDRAAILIEDAARGLGAAWRGEPMPAALIEMSADARDALDRSYFTGAVELRWLGAVRVMPSIDTGPAAGTLALMAPGTIIMPGTPIAWWVERDGSSIKAALSEAEVTEPLVPHQVYRQLDEDGRLVRDIIRPVVDDPIAGMPLLVPLSRGGESVGSFPLQATVWEAMQRAAMVAAIIPVIDG